MKFLRAIISLLRFDRTNWTALALCVIAACVFWIFNALNKNYSTNLSLPLLVAYDQSRYAPAEVLPAKLTVNVSGNGWELLRKSLDQQTPIAIPIERPTDIRRIPGASLAPQVMSQLGPLQLNFVVLDTLRLSIQEKATRRLSLKVDLKNISFRKNMGRISDVTLIPDSLELEGPASYLAALPDTLTLTVPRRLIGARYRETLEIQLEKSDFIRRNPPVVEVMFEVGPLDEVNLLLPLSPPPGIVADRDSLLCLVSIPQRDHQRWAADSAKVVVELPALSLRKGDTLTVVPRLTGLPLFASLLRIDSVQVTRKR